MITAKACTTHAGECWGQQDVGHGIVATGRGALRLCPLNCSCGAFSSSFSRRTLHKPP
ncbi:hypothetical protein [Rummeliibacillus sp. SL167]|uniref:hypothetical protein n=1 Tax=Rummeliibacillus sp. SL167 TaxID=2579792 RepID=UPI0016461275|nr:hypothetical protein [Rummeliibacillus sp. SL167]